MWGGKKKGLSLDHDSPGKKQLTSFLGVFNLAACKWDKISTIGTSPGGTIEYSCCNIREEVFYFGGKCKGDDCFHNNLFVLNTGNKEWREVSVGGNETQPIKKAGSGIFSFTECGEDYLLVIGGHGLVPADVPTNFQYTILYNNPSVCYINEVHLICVSSGNLCTSYQREKKTYFQKT